MTRPSPRLAGIPGFGIDRIAAAAAADPAMLRLENLDTDVPPLAAAVEATRAAVGGDEFNSYLPFTGRHDLEAAVAAHVKRRSGVAYDPDSEVTISPDDGPLLNALHATTAPGDEVILTDPTYAGILNRVRLAGAIPKLVPLVAQAEGAGGWRLDLEALSAAVTPRTRAMFLASASFPSGWVANEEEWDTIAGLCREYDLWLIYWSMMEAILFGGRTVRHPAALEGMRERTITLGSVSSEQRLIGWRVGWAVAPQPVLSDLALCHIYNGITTSGFAQAGARVALEAGDDDVLKAAREFERREQVVAEQCDGLHYVRSHGGWSGLLDAEAGGLSAPELSERLLAQGVAATPMTAWGETVAPRHVRLVFSNEPVERLATLGEKLRRAYAANNR